MGASDSIPTEPRTKDDLYRQVAGIYGSALDRLARGYEADPDKRRDLNQDIHFQLWRSFELYDGRCSLRTWVYRVAHRVGASHVLRQRRIFERLVTLEDLDVAASAAHRHQASDDSLNAERLALLIRQLMPIDRQVIISLA